jgi:hypothetical protein
MRKEKEANSDKEYYMCYAYVTENGAAADQKMENSIKLIGKEFKK